MANENENRTLGLDDPQSILEMRRRHLDLGLRLQRLAIIGLQEIEEKIQQKVAAGQSVDMSAKTKKESGDSPKPKVKKPN